MNDLPLAPEFKGITEWLNSDALLLKELRGKVIGLEFWTHSCGNCDNAAPHMQEIYEKYKDKGFILIGIHTPELESDRNIESIRQYIQEKGLTFPVAVDNDMIMWSLYGNRYWPTLYLIDKEGRINERHIGEGGYQRIRQDIEHLLKS